MGKWITKIKRKCLICKRIYLPSSNSQKVCQFCKEKKCLYCGKVFKLVKIELKKQYRGKFCSLECYLKSRWKQEKCKNCGKLSKFRYCSNKCQKEFWNKNDYWINKKRKFWEQKLEIIKGLGGKCKKCGFSDYRAIDINHVDKIKKFIPKHRHFTWQIRLKDWKNNKNNLELLCANCHRIYTWKQMGYGKIPTRNEN